MNQQLFDYTTEDSEGEDEQQQSHDEYATEDSDDDEDEESEAASKVGSEDDDFSNSQPVSNRGRKTRAKTSQHKNVCFLSREKKWLATFNFNGNRCILGYFESEEDAAAAVAIARKQIADG